VGWILAFAVAATVAGQPVSDEQVAHWARAKGGDQSAFSFLVQAKWTELEAKTRGVEVSDATAEEAADPPRGGLKKRDAIYEARVGLLKAGIQDQIAEPAAKSVTPEQVKAYVDAHPKFLPEARRIRLVRTKTRADARRAERELERGGRWKVVARRYAGGGTTTVQRSDERFPGKATGAMFAARRGVVARNGVYVFKVLEVIPPRPMNRAQQEAQAWEVLAGEAQERAVAAFNGAFFEKWRQQTSCAPSYATSPVCPT
jgi:hypothetical protein